MVKNQKKDWTDKENQLLAEYYFTLSKDAMLAILPGRSLVDMKLQVAKLDRKNIKFRRKDGRYSNSQ